VESRINVGKDVPTRKKKKMKVEEGEGGNKAKGRGGNKAM